MTIMSSLVKAIELLKTHKIEDPILKARLLLAFVLNESKEYIIINGEKEVEPKVEKKYESLLNELVKHVPLQYITSSQEFMGLNFYINEDVLIPRQDTEILVEEVLKRIDLKKKYKILDMCTGSGVIAVSLAKNILKCEITAVDISARALKVASRNAEINGVSDKIEFVESNMFSKVKEKYDIIVSNPPYVDKEHMNLLSKEVKKEPFTALYGGNEGLKFYKILGTKSKEYLNDKGLLFLEIGYNQKEQVCEILNNQGYRDIMCIKDLAGHDRVITAFKKI